MICFDGVRFAQQKESALRTAVQQLESEGKRLKIAAVLFAEDVGSALYTRLKQEAAQRVGIEYQVSTFSLRDDVTEVQEKVSQLCADPTITGCIIQKPWRKTWSAAHPERVEKSEFGEWWESLTECIAISKDVDGLHPETLLAIKNGTWREEGKVLPATAAAVLNIVRHSFAEQGGGHSSMNLELSARYGIPQDWQVVILGKSDIVGKPIFYELQNAGVAAEMIGSAELQTRISSGQKLLDADLIISATGRQHLITGDMVQSGVFVIDVGEPRADVAFDSVAPKAAFLTPVPGGVGPVTVACLLENCLTLGQKS